MILGRGGAAFGVCETCLRSVCPFNRLWSPVIFVIVDIGPFRLCTTTVLLDARGHVNPILLFEFLVGQMLRGSRLGRCNKSGSSMSMETGNIRRFLFHTWFGSGPAGFVPPAPALDIESRILVVVLATKRGREVCGGVPRGVEDGGGAKQLDSLAIWRKRDAYLSRQA